LREVHAEGNAIMADPLANKIDRLLQDRPFLQFIGASLLFQTINDSQVVLVHYLFFCIICSFEEANCDLSHILQSCSAIIAVPAEATMSENRQPAQQKSSILWV